MNILFPYTGDSVGGSHVSSLMLAQGLRETGHQVTLGLHRPGGVLSQWFADRGESVVALPDVTAPKLRAMWRQALPRRAARRALAAVRDQYDVIHTHDMRNHLIWSAVTAGSSVPHIWHQRTPASGRHMEPYGRAADAFIAVSEFTLSSLPQGLHTHAQVIYNPFVAQDPASEAARDDLCAALGVPAGTKVIGYVANFSDRKRPELFVDIAAVVAAGRNDVVFAMFGAPNEPHVTRVRDKAKSLGLQDTLHIMGLKNPFGPWMAGLSALVAPARDEALGRTLIEAGFAGVPVIATDEGGNREIIVDGATGRLVAPDDVTGFSDAVLATLDDPVETAKRCEAAKERVEQTFSLARHLAAMQKVYESLGH